MPAAVIYIQPGTVPHERQMMFCLEYCQRHDYRVAAIVPSHGAPDAVEMVDHGQADLIVAAFSARARPGDVRDLAAEHGVPVEYVRPPVVRKEVGELVARVYQNSGRDIAHTAKLLGLDTRGIRNILSRMGIRLPRREDGTTPDSRE